MQTLWDDIDINEWRDAYEAGKRYINLYLRKFSPREDDTDFAHRKTLTYCPAYARITVDDAAAKVLSQFNRIIREGTSSTYLPAAAGELGGVDGEGTTMEVFLNEIVTELFIMGRVGVFVNMPEFNPNSSLSESEQIQPYLSIIRRERIRKCVKKHGEVVYLELDEKESERSVYIRELGGVRYERYNCESEIVRQTFRDDIPIPFAMATITSSFMRDLASYQNALLQIASSDMSVIVRSIFPFYVEPYNTANSFPDMLKNGEVNADGDAEETNINLGALHGRRYPMQGQAPSFISPPVDPIKVSMLKQEQLKREMREIVRLNMTTLRPTDSSNQAMESTAGTFETGILLILSTLERLENQIASIWSTLDGKPVVRVTYPSVYIPTNPTERVTTAKDYLDLVETIPSVTFQKAMQMQAADFLLKGQVQPELLAQIRAEIAISPNSTCDPKTIQTDVELGLATAATASKLRGYPEGESKQAQEERLERLKQIAIMQEQGGGARGLGKIDPTDTTAVEEKKKDG